MTEISKMDEYLEPFKSYDIDKRLIIMNWTPSRSSSNRTRMRRMRSAGFSRQLMQENIVSPADFIYPVFVLEGSNRREAIASMPGIERLSVDLLCKEAKHIASLGIPAIALFPVIDNQKKSLKA